MNITEKHWFHQLALFVTIAGAIMVLYISYLLLFPSNVITVVQPYKVLTPTIHQGEKLSYEVEYCSVRPQFFVVQRELYNLDTGELWEIPDRVNVIDNECLKGIHEVLTPMRVDVGRYKMLAGVTIQINPLRQERYHYETEVFEVLPIEE